MGMEEWIGEGWVMLVPSRPVPSEQRLDALIIFTQHN